MDDYVDQKELEAYRALNSAISDRRQHHVTDAKAWQAMDARITQDEKGKATGLSMRRAQGLRRTHWIFAVAAACAVIALVVWRVTLGSPASAPAFREYATVAGQHRMVTLSDGTRIILAPESHVHLGDGYGHGKRDISLEGEAYFAVVHDNRHPFAVEAHGVITQDIGTQFDIRAYHDDSDVRVAVVEGVVAVVEAGLRPSGRSPRGLPRPSSPTMMDAGDIVPSFPPVMLRAGDMATMADSNITVAHQNDIATLTSWMQGGLTFDHTVFSDAIRELHRAFDVDIVVADSTLLSQHITASFGAVPVNEVLEAVTFAIGARYERVGRKVTIHRSSAATGQPEETHPVQPLSIAGVSSLHSSPLSHQ